jgi:hypothetical protein
MEVALKRSERHVVALKRSEKARSCARSLLINLIYKERRERNYIPCRITIVKT